MQAIAATGNITLGADAVGFLRPNHRNGGTIHGWEEPTSRNDQSQRGAGVSVAGDRADPGTAPRACSSRP